MTPPDLPADEPLRLSALLDLNLLDTPAEERFDRLTRLASKTLDMPIALVSLVDRHRQWFKSRVGLDVEETPRDISFCNHAIRSEQPLVVEDARRDQRFADNPLVTDDPNICFYAGVPLRDSHGFRVGTLCVLDQQPRHLSDGDLATLKDLADLVERELSLGVEAGVHEERNRALNILTEIALDTEGNADARATRALAIACDYLDMETGIVSRITGGAYTIHWHHAPPGTALSNGMTLPLEQTYCSILIQQQDVLAIEHMARSRFSQHPCYQHFGLESYLAAPVRIDDEIYGTINFSSRQSRQKPFSATEKMFVTLLGRWVADTIYQLQFTETLNKLVTQAPGMFYQNRLWPDGHSTFPYASPGILKIYGVTAEAVAVDAAVVFERIHPEDREAVARSIQESAAQLTEWQQEYRIRWAPDGWRWVEGQARPEKLPDNSVLWHGYIADVHERHLVNDMKNQFISTVSHELRTPLTSIAGSLGLVRGGVTGPLTEKAARMIEIAQRNSEHLRAVIDDLLDIEKLVSGNMTLDARVQAVPQLVQQAIEEIQPQARGRGVRIRYREQAANVRACFDHKRLKQALINLLSNAIKFSPEGGEVSVTLSVVDGQVQLDVQDQGPGVPDEFQARIFQKFAQADATSARSRDGTGLGLAITRELMQAMGGAVGFESPPGQGARFWLQLPAC